MHTFLPFSHFRCALRHCLTLSALHAYICARHCRSLLVDHLRYIRNACAYHIARRLTAPSSPLTPSPLLSPPPRRSLFIVDWKIIFTRHSINKQLPLAQDFISARDRAGKRGEDRERTARSAAIARVRVRARSTYSSGIGFWGHSEVPLSRFERDALR